MKLLNKIFYIIGTICIIMALYLLFDKYFIKDSISFDGEKELEIINEKLIDIGSSLGWIVIVDGIDNQDDADNYNITYNEDLFNNYSYRQLFVMEYILSNTSNYDKFVITSPYDVLEDNPTAEFVFAYLDYNCYNSYYKSLFGEDFDNAHSVKGPDDAGFTNYVYYENRRAGSNGVYVSMIQANGVTYDDGIYTAIVKVTYSTRASELIGEEESTAVIEYTKDINDNIIFKSFTLKNS